MFVEKPPKIKVTVINRASKVTKPKGGEEGGVETSRSIFLQKTQLELQIRRSQKGPVKVLKVSGRGDAAAWELQGLFWTVAPS